MKSKNLVLLFLYLGNLVFSSIKELSRSLGFFGPLSWIIFKLLFLTLKVTLYRHYFLLIYEKNSMLLCSSYGIHTDHTELTNMYNQVMI